MVFDVVVSAGKSAKQHHDLARAFIDLQISAHKLENSEEEFSHSAVAEIGCKRLVIEKEEEPQLEILTAKCYNDEIRARGYTDNFRIPLNPIQILFMQYIDLGSAKLPQVYQKTEAIAPPSPSNLLSSQSPEDVEDKI